MAYRAQKTPNRYGETFYGGKGFQGFNTIPVLPQGNPVSDEVVRRLTTAVPTTAREAFPTLIASTDPGVGGARTVSTHPFDTVPPMAGKVAGESVPSGGAGPAAEARAFGRTLPQGTPTEQFNMPPRGVAPEDYTPAQFAAEFMPDTGPLAMLKETMQGDPIRGGYEALKAMTGIDPGKYTMGFDIPGKVLSAVAPGMPGAGGPGGALISGALKLGELSANRAYNKQMAEEGYPALGGSVEREMLRMSQDPNRRGNVLGNPPQPYANEPNPVIPEANYRPETGGNEDVTGKGPLAAVSDYVNRLLTPNEAQTSAINAREKAPMDPTLANAEHQAFAQRMVDEFGPVGRAADLVLPPAYAAIKGGVQAIPGLGKAISDLSGGRLPNLEKATPPSFSQILAGMEPAWGGRNATAAAEAANPQPKKALDEYPNLDVMGTPRGPLMGKPLHNDAIPKYVVTPYAVAGHSGYYTYQPGINPAWKPGAEKASALPGTITGQGKNLTPGYSTENPGIKYYPASATGQPVGSLGSAPRNAGGGAPRIGTSAGFSGIPTYADQPNPSATPAFSGVPQIPAAAPDYSQADAVPGPSNPTPQMGSAAAASLANPEGSYSGQGFTGGTTDLYMQPSYDMPDAPPGPSAGFGGWTTSFSAPSFNFSNPAVNYSLPGMLGFRKGGLVEGNEPGSPNVSSTTKHKLGQDPGDTAESGFTGIDIAQAGGSPVGTLSMGVPPAFDSFLPVGDPVDTTAGWIFPGLGSGGGGGEKKGGLIKRGNPKSKTDDVPAMLQNGEYVVPRKDMRALAQKTGSFEAAATEIKEFIKGFSSKSREERGGSDNEDHVGQSPRGRLGNRIQAARGR